jgi:hypothetical protein
LLLESTRGPIELTRTAAQRLACDADWRILLADGADILGATAKHPAVSVALRAALVARDGGCRFPGCRQPAAVCVNHHVIRKADGGPTELENVALLCEAHHHSVHEGGWTSTLHPDGSMTFTRRGITLTSLPRGDRYFKAKTRPPGGRPTRQPTQPADAEPHPSQAPNQPPPPPPDDLPF